ncbi:MAG: NAD-dependent epimerase/dehydratase [Deltaproteobacteria bacterium]|nr:NAD-dependent epimerase/dehydratase [Deltaproteobacteria bacterium]
MSSRQVLITGGAGFLGVHLTDRFRKAEMRVRLFDFAEPPPWAQEPGVEYMRRDTRNLAEVISSLKGVDSVVHAAFSSPRESLETLHSVNVDGTKNLCAGAIAQGVRRFILISSTIVLRPQRVHGLSVAIVRPKTFIGPSRVSAFEIIFDWVRCGRPVLILGSGQNRYQLLDVRDMAEGIRLIEAAKGEGVFSLGAQEFQTVRESLFPNGTP